MQREKRFYKFVLEQMYGGLLDTTPKLLLTNLVPQATPSYSAKTE